MSQVRLTRLQQRYQDLNRLNEGGMGVVYTAQDPILERQVAIKSVLPGTAAGSVEVQRFLAEARATGRLQHPCIPPVYELGRDEDGRPFFSLLLIRGQSMGQLIRLLREGSPDLHQQYRFHHRLEVFLKVCEAVAYAHAQGVLHRDIKPDNIMLGEWGEVFLVDWGLAREESTSADLTGKWSVIGTPGFLAPEMFTGTRASEATDLYGLNATLYEWLTLRRATEGKYLSEIVQNTLQKIPLEACSLNHAQQGRVPKEMSNLLWRGLEKDPGKRFQSLDDYMAEIRLILDGFSCPVCPHTAVKSGLNGLSRWIDNHPRTGLILFFVLVALAALGWGSLLLWFLP